MLQVLNPFDNRILRWKEYKTRITDLDRLTMPLTNGCCNDDVIQLGPFSSCNYGSSRCVFCTPSFAVFPTCYNQLRSNLVNVEATVKN